MNENNKGFINRNKEVSILKEESESITGKNLIILKGTTGVGKSELSKQFLKGYKKYPAIKVEIQKKSQDEPGYYLNEIKQDSNKPINNIYFTGNENKYILKEHSFNLIAKLALHLFEVVPIIKPMVQVFSKTIDDYKKAKEKLNDFYDQKGIIEIKKYLEYLYCKEPFILNIENIQIIDEISWKKLYEVLTSAPDYILLLEYTENIESNISISYIIDEYQKIIEDKSIKLIGIERLSDKHILELSKEISKTEQENIKEQLPNWNGNIKTIKDFIYTTEYGYDVKINDSTNQLIKCLSIEELSCLIKIYINPNNITKNMDLDIGLNELIYKSLINKNLISEKDDTITTSHDSICHILDSDDYNDIRKESVDFWYKYYKDKYINTFETHSMYQYLYFVLLENNAEDLITVLGDIHEKVIVATDPFGYLEKIEKIYYSKIYNCSDSTLDQLLFWIVELYQNLGSYQKAQIFFSFIENKNSNKYIALKSLILYQAGFQNDATEHCSSFLKDKTIDSHLELFLRLVRLVANYTLCNQVETEKEFKYIEENYKKFERHVEYGFFLRNAELVKNRKEQIIYFKKSIEHFERFGAKKQSVSSRINLGVSYALLGKLEDAEKQFQIANDEKEEFIGLYDMILNNQAVIMQYKGNLKNVKEKLLLARQYASYDFNKLAIFNNLLVYNIRMNIEDHLLIEQMLEIIEKRTFKNTRIIIYAYINIYNYYKTRNQERAEKFYNKIFEFGTLPYYINEWLGKATLKEDDPEYNRTRIKWPINFINEWSIEFDSSLMHFE